MKDLGSGGIGHQMSSKVKSVKQGVYRVVNMVVDFAYFQSVPDRPLLALYIGGQVSRNRRGPIHITTSVYDMNSYFDYDYTWA
jgi:hypothetical protein